ncbi:PLP-dependent cysteine synthase family protein [Blastococcus brunescens]|uniref:Pyridoxal-phosphate dependent enzyme n=1 Tax=Blastococcus brunescens TaxID=1564165 RepID=A0ABZ1AVR0_9ACTN|nr:pyridoxal-phosphate dependent enzyme [Blastococcus sp. BMG 8361]WRL62652.1 pyridoxal-phosphate dependent enzyme [Blastococcus sp. BMG 8361]
MGVELYLKDESTHPTGSLKHRLARSLFLYGLCSGQITEGTTVVESSSGSTAVSEAYFARMLGLPFVAVMPASTSPEKVELIEFHGGRCHFVDRPADIYDEARQLAAECGGHYLDQFTNAERATDWRGNNNIAESIFSQLALERYPTPEWVVVGAGTGGTSATIGRYLRYRRLPTRLAVVDPEGSSFFPGWRDRAPATATGLSSRIEGIGRPRVEPSFVPTIVDRMICVPDAASLAAMRELERTTGRRAGGSTGTNLWGRSSWSRRWSPPAAPAAWSPCCATAASATPTPTTPTSGWWGSVWTWRRTPRRWPTSPRRGMARPLTGRSEQNGPTGRRPEPHRPAGARRRVRSGRPGVTLLTRPRTAAALPASNLHSRSQAGPRARVLNAS